MQGPLQRLKDCRVYIETYGCTYNLCDTRKIIDIVTSRGCTLVKSPDDADAVIVNTCTVVAATERRMIRALHRLRHKTVYVAGCMPLVQRDQILGVCTPEFITPEEIKSEYSQICPGIPYEVGIVQIAKGCRGSCTYCITQKARGSLVSTPADEILGEIERLVAGGSREIQLTAQDTAAWGYDIGGRLPDLLDSIVEIPGRFFIRVGMMNPASAGEIIKPLLESFSHTRIFKFVHIPVQSGSDRILGAMGRGYSKEDFYRIIEMFREKYPRISIATDLITGFPGEEEEDVAMSRDLLTRVRPNKVNITRFSMRPHTSVETAWDMPDYFKKQRSRLLQKHAEQIYREINSEWIGRTVPFMVTERIRPGTVMARTGEYLGVVIEQDLEPGYEGEALLVSDRQYFFIGVPVLQG